MMAFANASRREISSWNSLPQPQSIAFSMTRMPSTTSESLLRLAERLMLILTRRRSTKKSTCGSLAARSEPRPGIRAPLSEKGAQSALKLGVAEIVPCGRKLCRDYSLARGKSLVRHLAAEYRFRNEDGDGKDRGTMQHTPQRLCKFAVG